MTSLDKRMYNGFFQYAANHASRIRNRSPVNFIYSVRKTIGMQTECNLKLAYLLTTVFEL